MDQTLDQATLPPASLSPAKRPQTTTPRTRLIVADFAGSLLMALSIGLAISVVLAGAVLLLAQQPGSQSDAPITAPVEAGTPS